MAARWGFALLCLLLAGGSPRSAEPGPGREETAELLGRWVMQAEPEKVLELKAGGTGSFRGAPITWSVSGRRLTITDPGGTDTTGWKVVGDRLVLSGPFETEIVLLRESRGGPVPGGVPPSK
jgi:hypothetical protein